MTAKEKAENLYRKVNTFILTCVGADGYPLTKAGVYFYSRRLVWKGCLLKGDMEIVTDMSIKEKYWQNKFKNAYPQKSFTDPDFCVLKFIPKSGRFYSWYKPEDFDIN